MTISGAMADEAVASHDQWKKRPPLIDLTLNIRLLRVFGMLELEDVDSWKRCLHQGCCAACYVFMMLTIVANAFGTVHVWGDIDLVINGACSSVCMLFITIRGIYLTCRRRGMARLISRLLEFEDRLWLSEVSDEQANIIATTSRRVYMLTIAFYSFVFLIWIAWVISPVFADSSPQQPDRLHPLLAVYFFDHNKSPNYELVYLLQSAGLLMFVPAVCVFNTTAAALLLHIGAQFRVLLASVGCVRWLALREQGSQRERLSLTKPCRSETNGEKDRTIPNPHQILVSCIHYHDDLIKYVKDYDEIYHHIMLFQFLYSSFIIALCGFEIIEGSNFGTVMKFVLLGMSFLFEMFLFCKCGDDILQLSQRVGDAAFACGWLGADRTVKISVMMIIMRARRPCHITAYHVKVLCLQTMAAIINTSYSYMALLLQFKRKN